MKIKCINCINCNEKEKKCFPKSKDCRKEYELSEEDLYTEKECDFAKKK